MNKSTASLECLQSAQALFFNSSDLDANRLRRVLARMCHAKTDWADIYLQQTISRAWLFDGGQIKTGSYSIDRGAGLRTVCGETSTLAYTDILSEPSLLDAASTVAKHRYLEQSNDAVILPLSAHHQPYAPVYDIHDPADNANTTKALELIQEADALARSIDPRVIDVTVTLQCETDSMLLYRLDGLLTGDIKPMVYLSINVLTMENGRKERATVGGGSRLGLDFFTKERLYKWASDAVSEALHNLHAYPAPVGVMPVVLGHGWPGILLHEAIGHGLESDFIRKGTSAFSDMLGQRIASPGVTVVDDGTIANARGSISIDDEGTPASRTTLIEDGILTGFMHDLTNARLLS